MKEFLFKKLMCLFALIFLCAQNVCAQVIPPTNLDAGLIDRTTKENFQRIESTPTQKEEPTINGADSNTNSEKSSVLHTQKFNLNKIVYSGNSVIKTEDLEKLSQQLIGKEVAVNDIVELTNQISAIYRNNGYLTSFAYIPPQKIENGEIKINILEGKVGNISIQGNKWTRSSYIQKNILNYNNFQGQTIFNANSLRRSLGDMNQRTYLKGQATLQKGIAPETTDIILEIKDRFPVGIGASWDNTGRDFVGIQRAGISITDYNLTGLGDSLSSNLSFASGVFGVGTGYSIPLGNKGTLFNLGYSMSNAELGGYYKAYDIKSKTHDFCPGLYKPLIRKDDFDLSANMNFDLRHSATTLRGIDLTKYELRVLRAGINANKYDSKGRWIGSLETSTGIPILGGQSIKDKSVGDSKFFKVNTTAIRVQNLPFKSIGVFRVSGQFTPNTLLAPEQMNIGGMYTVRGFKEGVLLADMGYNATFEVRTPLSFLPEKVKLPIPFMKKKPDIAMKNRIQFVSFYDQGLTKLLHQDNSYDDGHFLQSVGVGLKCYLTNNISANVDFGVPLGAKKTISDDFGRFHFSISSNLF